MFSSMRGKTKLCNYICGVVTFILLAFQFVPFWAVPGTEKNYSIASFIWLNAKDRDILKYFQSATGYEANVNFLAAFCATIIICSVIGIVFSFTKSDKGILAIVPAIGAIAGIVAFTAVPEYLLGSTCVVQLIICALVLVAAIVTIVFDFKKVKQEAIGEKASARDIAAKVSTIKSLTTEVTAKKGSIAIAEANFNKLLAYLKDADYECRVAAAEMLGKTSKEIALTHITYLLETEENAEVAEAMRNALTSIRENMKA